MRKENCIVSIRYDLYTAVVTRTLGISLWHSSLVGYVSSARHHGRIQEYDEECYSHCGY